MSAFRPSSMRADLLAAAEAELAAGSPSKLSLRAVARATGASHQAPGHHFGDRAGLLTALAAEAYSLLADRVESLDDDATLIDLGAAYIRLAVERPALLQLITRPEEFRPDDAEVLAASTRAWQRLATVAGDDEAAQAAWALVTGFADLLQSGAVQPSDRTAAIDPDAAELAFRRSAGALLGRKWGGSACND